MNNLARIVSHGFAIIVVILLGLGFIYRGELFPDLELPDFLVPESEKLAGAGGKPGKVEPGVEAARETAAEEAASAASRSTIVETAPVVPAVPAVEAPSGTPATEAGKPPSEAPGVTPHEAAPAEKGIETTGESQQPLAKVVPPPAAEESGRGEGEHAGMGETVPGTAEPSRVPAPGPAPEQAAAPQAGVSGPAAGGELPPMAAESASEPGTSGQTALQTGSAIPPRMETPVPSTTTATERPTGGMTAGHVPPGSSAGGKPYEVLAAAREAFWLHNYDEAEKNYRELTELEPQNPDGYGELGNMFFSQGRWEEAAASYYEAGVRLVREGRLEPARNLVNVIRGLNGKQADDLEKLISSAATSEGSEGRP